MVDAVTTASAAGTISSGTKSLASNFETFLSLLTTQLKNQDPLSPVDSNEFTAQLTQMAGVEQQLLTNTRLKSLLGGQQAGGLSDAAAYIGKVAKDALGEVFTHDMRAVGARYDTAPLEGGSPFAGRALGDSQMRTRTGTSVVAVIRNEQAIPAPGPDYVLEAGDTVVVVGTANGVRRAARLLSSGADS